MKIEYLHASKYGNGALVAEEFSKQMAVKGATVHVRHIQEAKPKELPPADLYVFSSPARFGKPIGGMRRFLKKVELPAGTRYAILTTEAAAHPDIAGRVPSDQQMARWTRVSPIMADILQRKGLVEVAKGTVRVNGVKGPLEEGWQQKVKSLIADIPVQV
jgi:sulfite reductase alpha subunit-like flavoprotein